jgi:lipopolysaccharide transport system permease protein
MRARAKARWDDATLTVARGAFDKRRAPVALYDSKSLNLLWELTRSQFKLKDQSTFFGVLWSFLNPLFMVGVLFVFFNAQVGSTVEHYAIYLLLGLVQYTYFANATNTAMRVLLSMRQLTKDAVFPKELLVFSSTLSITIDLVIAMLVCVGVAYCSGVEPSWSALGLVLVVLLQLMLASWVSLLLSCVLLVARDIDHIYQVFLRALLFVTPIFYTRAFLGGAGLAHWLVTLNPLAQVIELSRGILLEGELPSIARMLVLFLVNAACVVATFRVFKRLEPRMAEYV